MRALKMRRVPLLSSLKPASQSSREPTISDFCEIPFVNRGQTLPGYMN